MNKSSFIFKFPAFETYMFRSFENTNIHFMSSKMSKQPFEKKNKRATSHEPRATSLEAWAMSIEPWTNTNRLIKYVSISSFQISESQLSYIKQINSTTFQDFQISHCKQLRFGSCKSSHNNESEISIYELVMHFK